MKRRKSRREKDSRAKGRLRAKILVAKREREGGEEKEPLASQKKSSSSTVLDPLRSHPSPPPRPVGPPAVSSKGKGWWRKKRTLLAWEWKKGSAKNPFASKDHLPSLFIHLRGGGLPFFYSSSVASVSLEEIRGGGRGKEDHHSKQPQEKRMGDKQNFQKQSSISSKC